MKVIGLLLVFEHAECRAYPVGDPGTEVELAERLSAFCHALLADDNVANCVVGLHGHRAGDCAKR